MALMPYAAVAAVPACRDWAWDVAMYPESPLPVDSREPTLGPLFYLASSAMVSTGLAGAHVQPVLEYFFYDSY
jgi:hypothetical protein